MDDPVGPGGGGAGRGGRASRAGLRPRHGGRATAWPRGAVQPPPIPPARRRPGEGPACAMGPLRPVAFASQGPRFASFGVRRVHGRVVPRPRREGFRVGQVQGGHAEVSGPGQAPRGLARRRRARARLVPRCARAVRAPAKGRHPRGHGPRAAAPAGSVGPQHGRPRLRRRRPQPDQLLRLSGRVRRRHLAGLQGHGVPIPGAGTFRRRRDLPGVHGQAAEARRGHPTHHGRGGVSLGLVAPAQQAGHQRRVGLPHCQRLVHPPLGFLQPTPRHPSEPRPRPLQLGYLRPPACRRRGSHEPRADAVCLRDSPEPPARAEARVAQGRHPALAPRGGLLLGGRLRRLRHPCVRHRHHPRRGRARADPLGHQSPVGRQASLRPRASA